MPKMRYLLLALFLIYSFSCEHRNPTDPDTGEEGQTQQQEAQEEDAAIYTVLNLSATKNTYVSQRNPDRNYGQATRLLVSSREVSTGEHRAYIYFPFSSSSFPTHTVIDSAKVILFHQREHPFDHTLTVFACELTRSFSETQTTWNNKPASKSFRWIRVLKNDNLIGHFECRRFHIVQYKHRGWFSRISNE